MEDARSSVLSRAVQVQGGLVTKTQEPDRSRRERLRTLAGRRVGEETGLFTVPAVLSFDDAAGTIVFERLALTSLRTALTDPVGGMEIAERVGRVLAAIHRQLPISGTPVMGLTTPTASMRPTVPVHGDFGIANVLFQSGTERIAVIDWSNADWTGVDGDLAPPETDIAVFLTSLFHRRLFDGVPRSRREGIARHFLETYAAAGPHGVDVGCLKRTIAAAAPAFKRLTRRLKGPFKSLAYRGGPTELSHFLERISRDGLTSGRH